MRIPNPLNPDRMTPQERRAELAAEYDSTAFWAAR